MQQCSIIDLYLKSQQTFDFVFLQFSCLSWILLITVQNHGKAMGRREIPFTSMNHHEASTFTML